MLRAVALGSNRRAEPEMRAQILAVLEELCRDLTLHDVREWYLDSLHDPAPGMDAGSSD